MTSPSNDDDKRKQFEDARKEFEDVEEAQQSSAGQQSKGPSGQSKSSSSSAPGPSLRVLSRDAAKLLTELNRDNCVVLDGGKVRVLRFEQVQHRLNGREYSYRVPMYLSIDDFNALYMNRYIRGADDKPIELGKWWLHRRDRRQYLGVVFEPGRPLVVNRKLNLWTGWGVEPKPGDCSLLREHIFAVLAKRQQALFDYIFNWLAWAVQNPSQQPETALVFLGKRGTGRGTLGNAMCRLFGNHGLHISSPQHLVGRFNAHQRQCSFLFADEAYAVSDKRAESSLKAKITEPTLVIEAKGKDIIIVPNALHVMMASNADWVVPAGEVERRFVVEEVSDEHAQEAAWFEPLYQQLEHGGGLEALLFELRARDLGKWHPRAIIRTEALAYQQAQSLSAFDAWWEDLLHDGYLPAGDSAGLVISGEYRVKMSEGFLTDNSKKTWFEKRKGFYEQARTSSPELKKATDAAFGRYLVKRGGKSQYVRRQRGWQLPTLEKCRAEWLRRFPDTVWNDPAAKAWQGERDQDDDDDI